MATKSAARRRADRAKKKAAKNPSRDLSARSKQKELADRKAIQHAADGTPIAATLEDALELIKAKKPEGEPDAYVMPWEVKQLLGGFLEQHQYRAVHQHIRALDELEPLE